MVHGVAGGALASATGNGGKIWPITLGTTAAPIIAVNGQRQSIMFNNVGAATAYVAPVTTATGAPLTPSLSALAGCIQIVAGATFVLFGECQCAWQGFAASSGNPLTILESNV
jgi:hypothetical protein